MGGSVQVSIGEKVGKSSQNSDILGSDITCILFVYTLLTFLSHYDLSVLSAVAMSLKERSLNRGLKSRVSPIFLFNFAKPVGHARAVESAFNYK